MLFNDLPSYIFGNISIICGIIQIDQCNVTCVYPKSRGHSFQLLYFTIYYFKG